MITTDLRSYWLDGRAISPEQAAIHPMTHALHYGTGVFEGIRAYDTAAGTAIFRLDDHLRRLYVSASAYGLAIPYSHDDLAAAVRATVRASGLPESYIRPLVYFGDKLPAFAPRYYCPTHVLIAVIPLPPVYPSTGIRATLSPIMKTPSRALPARIKASGHYTNAVLAMHDAVERGFDEAILLNERGEIAEATGENVFIVAGGTLHTNDLDADVLAGITRDTVLRMAADEGIPVTIAPITLEALAAADEVFLTGTAAEIVPVKAVDERSYLGDGPIVRRLRERYARVVRAEDRTFRDWSTPA
jgi:branched-chain amino acid aminotransferase